MASGFGAGRNFPTAAQSTTYRATRSDGAAGACYSAIEFASVPQQRMINATGKLHAGGVRFSAILNIHRGKSENVLISRRRAARCQRIEFEAGGDRVPIGSVEVEAN